MAVRAPAIYPLIRIKGYIDDCGLSNTGAVALCLFLSSAADARAQAVIEWSADAKLTIRHFQGRPPINAASASLSWLNVEAGWECQAGALFASARATFDPSRSWWRGALRGGPGSARRARAEAARSIMPLDRQLLEHEQLHFDIAELAARKLRSRFDALRAACDDDDGSERIREMVATVDRELHAEQQRYDRETAHGLDARAQDQWKRRIRARLESGP